MCYVTFVDLLYMLSYSWYLWNETHLIRYTVFLIYHLISGAIGGQPHLVFWVCVLNRFLPKRFLETFHPEIANVYTTSWPPSPQKVGEANSTEIYTGWEELREPGTLLECLSVSYPTQGLTILWKMKEEIQEFTGLALRTLAPVCQQITQWRSSSQVPPPWTQAY